MANHRLRECIRPVTGHERTGLAIPPKKPKTEAVSYRFHGGLRGEIYCPRSTGETPATRAWAEPTAQKLRATFLSDFLVPLQFPRPLVLAASTSGVFIPVSVSRAPASPDEL